MSSQSGRSSGVSRSSSPLAFNFVGAGNLQRLEIGWAGKGDPPWHGERGLCEEVLEAVCRAARTVPYITGEPRTSVSSSTYLRVWVQLPNPPASVRGRRLSL